MSASSPKDNKKKEKINTKPQDGLKGSTQVSRADQPENQVFLTKQQKMLYCLSFAGMGLVMGFLWGANSIIDVGQSASPLVQAAKASLAVATTSADIAKGIYYGLVGALIGISYGYSISLSSKPMLTSLIAGCVGLWIGILLGGPALAGVGWIIGYGAVIFNAIGLDRYRQVYKQVAQERASKNN